MSIHAALIPLIPTHLYPWYNSKMTRETDNEAFVRAYQASKGLKVDGWAGRDTLASLTRSGDVFEIPQKPNTSQPDPELISALKVDEGLRLKAYKDTVGVWTVGYGHAHVSPGTEWTKEKAEQVLIDDIREHNAKLLTALPWISNLDPVRRRVLQNMAFNLGVNGLLGFKNTLEFVHTGQYDKAADGMMASKWASQVKGRAVRLSQEMKTGRA